MAGIKHAFTSAKADGVDPTIVRPLNWNADHTITGNTSWGGFKLTGLGAATAAGDALSYDQTAARLASLGIGMTPTNILDITQTQNSNSIAKLKNASTGTGATAKFAAGNSVSELSMVQFGTGYTTSGAFRQDGGYIGTDGSGGLTFNIPSNLYYWCFSGTAYMTLSSSAYTCTPPATFLNGIDVYGFGGHVQMSGPGIDASTDFRVIAGGSGGVALLSGATAWSVYSDERMKDTFTGIPVEGALARVASWQAGTYHYKTDDKSKAQRRVGLLAQSVQKTRPEAVSVDEDGMLQLRLTELIPDLVVAIQEQVVINAALTARIEALEAKLGKVI